MVGEEAQEEAVFDLTRWHPRLVRLYRYWQSLRGDDGALPVRRAFDPTAMAESLPYIWMLDVQHEPFRLRYRLVGTKVVQAMGREVTGRWLDDTHPEANDLPTFFHRYRHFVAVGRPSWRKGPLSLWTDQRISGAEHLRLPFRAAAESTRVDIVLVGSVMYDLLGGEF